jgi:uncharacterized membrane protein
MYINTSSVQHITRKPSQLVNHVKKAQRKRQRARRRADFWLTYKAVLAATLTYAVGGALLGLLFYVTILSSIIGQASGYAP